MPGAQVTMVTQPGNKKATFTHSLTKTATYTTLTKNIWSLPVLFVDLKVVGALTNGWVERKGLIQVTCFWGTKAVNKDEYIFQICIFLNKSASGD